MVNGGVQSNVVLLLLLLLLDSTDYQLGGGGTDHEMNYKYLKSTQY